MPVISTSSKNRLLTNVSVSEVTNSKPSTRTRRRNRTEGKR